MSKKAGISYLQILILVTATFAFCYIIYNATLVLAQDSKEEKNDFDVLVEQIYQELYGGYYQTEETLIYSLADSLEGYVCCEKTIGGNTCQFVEEEKCDDNFRIAPTRCEYTDFCRVGCCIAPSGFCSEASTKRDCDGKWVEERYCNIQECQRGCCILGSQALWVYPGECEEEASSRGIETDFRPDISTQEECTYLTEKDDEGACVFEEDYSKICKFTTREKCEQIDGYFYKNIFCSDAGLEAGCEPHDYYACAENPIGGDDSVYWFDSCGNKEDIKEECSIFLGTVCGQENGDYTCKSIDCVARNGRTYKNGESWCEYEGQVGNGKDVVGSRHYRHICFMGEERVEPCADYRNQICVGTETNLGNGETFSEAACRINNWQWCIEYNTREDANPEENPDCITKSIDVDKFKFDMTVPKYPPGFNLKNNPDGARQICSMASQKCTVIYEKDWDGDWDCKINCDCEKAEFAQQMNELCTSLGDCGGYVNIAGETTDDGYSVSRTPKSGDLGEGNEWPNPNLKMEDPGDLSFLTAFAEPTTPSPGDARTTGGAGLGMTGVGFMMQVATWTVVEDYGLTAAISETISQGAALGGQLGHISSFSNALAGAGIVLAIGSIAVKMLGIEGKGAEIIMIASIVAASWTAVSIIGGIGGTATQLWGFIYYNPLALLFLVIIIAIVKIFGIGDTKEKIVEFKCLPWQPPSGGADCGKCDEEPLGGELRPCTEYRCQSLGQTCELINKGSEAQKCVDNNPTDVTSPKISPLLETISTGYKYVDTKGNDYLDGFEILSEEESCIPEFTPVLFGIETDKPAQCKIGTSPLETYNEMSDYFGDDNFYLTKHISILNLPSPESLKYQYDLTDKQIKELGEVNFYVKCKSLNGVENTATYTIKSCVKPGPDLTSPYVTKTVPASGGYVAYDATEQGLQVWVNEPAVCRYSENDKDYIFMENEMSCKTNFGDYGLWGWPCNTTLTGLDTNTKFYIRCRDISDNNNTMSKGYVYELQESASELFIEKILPEEDIISGVEPVSVDLEVYTSGGAENGVAKCYYGRNGRYISFFETYSNYHKQPLIDRLEGEYNFDIKCEDVAGNIAEGKVEFNIDIDKEAPVITRVYYDGSLKIVTDEPATCAYSFTDSKCRFDIENATFMSGQEEEHSADWQTDSIFYIKCKDIYGREPGRCSITVRPYDIT